MNLILITKRHGRPTTLDLGSPMGLAMSVLAVAVAVSAVFGLGVAWSHWSGGYEARVRAETWQREFARQRAEIAEARLAAQEGVDALAARLGQTQAHVLRLDALGQRLTRMAELDEGEFDFDNPPALGGPESEAGGEPVALADFVTALDTLGGQLEHRERQLTVLENLLLNRNMRRQVLPAGRPIAGGWISSNFGYRNDPFTGQRAFHGGLDFSGRGGAPVVAVAPGVVTWSGDRYGYGRMIEINHGNGYVTRYAHNRENLVRVGDPVKKGERVALMGATGRATAPHVHFEVLYNGRVVDPLKYIRASD